MFDIGFHASLLVRGHHLKISVVEHNHLIAGQFCIGKLRGAVNRKLGRTPDTEQVLFRSIRVLRNIKEAWLIKGDGAGETQFSLAFGAKYAN